MLKDFFKLRSPLPRWMILPLGLIPMVLLLAVWWIMTSGPVEQRMISPTLLPLPALAQQIVDWGLIGFDPMRNNYAKSVGIEVGNAYWVYMAEDNVANIVGYGPGSDGLSAALSSGWHFVGPALPLAWRSDAEVAWEWRDRTYRLAEVLQPGHGYWLYRSPP